MEDSSDCESLSLQSQHIDTYEDMLVKQDATIHNIIKDILSCKMDDIKKTRVQDMLDVLEQFSGTTLNKKKEELMEFLRIMPEYKTTDKEVMARRLTALKAELKRRGEIQDLLIWAKINYHKQNGE